MWLLEIKHQYFHKYGGLLKNTSTFRSKFYLLIKKSAAETTYFAEYWIYSWIFDGAFAPAKFRQSWCKTSSANELQEPGEISKSSSKLIKNYFENYWDSTLGPSIFWAGNWCIVDIVINAWSQYFVNLQIILSLGILRPTNESTEKLKIFKKKDMRHFDREIQMCPLRLLRSSNLYHGCPIQTFPA